MRPNSKTRAFMAFSLDLLGYKKPITSVNVFCNAIIFSHQAAVTFCIRQILNGLEGEPGRALHNALPYLAGILIVSLIRIAAIMGCAALDAVRSYYYQNRARLNALKLLLRKDDVTQVSGHSGRIFETLDEDIPICTFPAELFTEVTGYFIYTLIALSMLFCINWQLTLFIFIPLSVAIYGVQRLSERMKERRRVNRAAHDAVGAFISDVTDAVLAVKTAGAENSVLKQYDDVNGHRRGAVIKDAAYNAQVFALLQGAVCVGSAVMMFVASRLMAAGSFGIGDLSLFIAHLGTLADCVNRIVELIYEARKAEVSYERVLENIGEENIKQLSAEAGVALRHQPEEFVQIYEDNQLSSFDVKNLCFSYTGDDGFHDVSFSVNKGELITVTGGMASGKSTLLSVLMGLMPASGGEILWNGNSITQGTVKRTPGLIAGAPQRSGFFATDIETNLRLGIGVSEADIADALFTASLDDAIAAMPEGISTDIGGRGDRLSGGQQQRLALARTLTRGAALNIVDDCIGALDENTRMEVLRRLTAYIKRTGRSVIIATNERAFLTAADRILFMEGGRIAATGKYNELLVTCAAIDDVAT